MVSYGSIYDCWNYSPPKETGRGMMEILAEIRNRDHHLLEDVPYLLALVEELQNKLKIAHDIGETNTKALLTELNEVDKRGEGLIKIRDGKGDAQKIAWDLMPKDGKG